MSFENKDLDFTVVAKEVQEVKTESSLRTELDKNINFDFLSAYRNVPIEQEKILEEIAFEENVGSWIVNKFSLEHVNWMITNPGLFKGKEDEVPEYEDLIKLKKILSARLVLEERHPDKKYSVN